MAKLKALAGQRRRRLSGRAAAQPHRRAGARRADDDAPSPVAGRVLRIRDYGGVLFAQLRDWSGEVQLLLDNSRLKRGPTPRTSPPPSTSAT